MDWRFILNAVLTIAKKLPLTAAPAARTGGPRSGAPGGRTGVDLNKQANALGGQNEACNC